MCVAHPLILQKRYMNLLVVQLRSDQISVIKIDKEKLMSNTPVHNQTNSPGVNRTTWKRFRAGRCSDKSISLADDGQQRDHFLFQMLNQNQVLLAK